MCKEENELESCDTKCIDCTDDGEDCSCECQSHCEGGFYSCGTDMLKSIKDTIGNIRKSIDKTLFEEERK
jgi:hypothetical protein